MKKQKPIFVLLLLLLTHALAVSQELNGNKDNPILASSNHLTLQCGLKPDSAALSPEFLSTIDRIAKELSSDPSIIIRIDGHSDNSGTMQQSDARALNYAVRVKDALIAKGIAPKRIVTRGFGARVPIVSNRTSAGRSQNCRVEIVQVRMPVNRSRPPVDSLQKR